MRLYRAMHGQLTHGQLAHGQLITDARALQTLGAGPLGHSLSRLASQSLGHGGVRDAGRGRGGIGPHGAHAILPPAQAAAALLEDLVGLLPHACAAGAAAEDVMQLIMQVCSVFAISTSCIQRSCAWLP